MKLLLQNTKIYYLLFIQPTEISVCLGEPSDSLIPLAALQSTANAGCVTKRTKKMEKMVAFWCCEIYLLHSIIEEPLQQERLLVAIKHTRIFFFFFTIFESNDLDFAANRISWKKPCWVSGVVIWWIPIMMPPSTMDCN